MQTAKFIFSAINYGFYILYGFTLIDVVKKLAFHEFYLDNAMNVSQLMLTIIGVFFAYYKMKAYKRDSETRSKILEQELRTKELDNFYRKYNKEFNEPFKKEEE
ncbi:hypothetical protein D3C85_408310 [compost metagenome]